MLTIKWISADGDNEMLYIGHSVSFTRKPEGENARPTVSFMGVNDVHCSIDSGRVFVMNEHGSTVADYILATTEYPNGVYGSKPAK